MFDHFFFKVSEASHYIPLNLSWATTTWVQGSGQIAAYNRPNVTLYAENSGGPHENEIKWTNQGQKQLSFGWWFSRGQRVPKVPNSRLLQHRPLTFSIFSSSKIEVPELRPKQGSKMKRAPPQEANVPKRTVGNAPNAKGSKEDISEAKKGVTVVSLAEGDTEKKQEESSEAREASR